MSSVDDPEKHFLGNLLEDDTGFTSSSVVGGTSSSSASASSSGASQSSSILSQLSNIGPVMSPGTNPSSSGPWPEPPPPYSPPATWPSSNINLTLQGSSASAIPETSWFTASDRRDPQPTMDYLSQMSSMTDGYFLNPPPQNKFLLQQQQQQHQIQQQQPQNHFHKVDLHWNFYLKSPPTESLTPQVPMRPEAPLYDSLSSSYDGIFTQIPTNNTMGFSQFKQSLGFQESPQPTVFSESTLSPRTVVLPQEEAVHQPLSPAEVVEVAKEKKQISKSYADHLSKSSASTPKKGNAIGAEKKQKQELAKKMSSQTLGETIASKITVKGQPHSAPVVTKMPFSYRDVAARVEHNISSAISHHEDAAAHNERKDASSTCQNGTKGAQTKSNELLRSKESENSKKNDGSRKSRADNEFQKINNRKNKKENNAKAAPAPVVLESVHPVDSSSRYDVLKNLENLPAQRNGKKNERTNGRPPLIQEIFSRSSSPAEDLDTEEEETVRNRSASNHAHLNGNGQMKKEQKKRVVQSNQRRRKGRKAEKTWIDNAIAHGLDFLAILWGYIVIMFQWTFELIVDVCVKIYDVFLCSFECVCSGTMKGIRKVFLSIVCFLCGLVSYFKRGAILVSSFTLLKIFGFEEEPFEEEEKELDWGCKKELPIPTNATEYAERLSRETIRDAYSVFGLKCDCSDDDIKRNFKRIVALVSPDKCTIESADDVFFLVNMAFEAIGNQEARAAYTVENAKDNVKHEKVVRAWEEMSVHFEDSRNRLFCDCSNHHYRVATNIIPSQARFCKRCAAHHPAKQNDIWVEKRNFGLTSVYLTCTDNIVYDITEWAVCEKNKSGLALADCNNCHKPKDLPFKRRARKI